MDLKARIGLLVEAQGARRAAADVDGVAKPIRRIGTEAETTGHKFRRAEVQALSFRKGLIGMTTFVSAGAAGIFGLGAVLHGAASEYEDAWKAGQATNAVIASTGGVANVSAKGVEDLSQSLALKAGIDDQLIQKGANLLLTFRNIRNEAGLGNDIFNQTTQAAVDMSAAFTAAGKSMDVSEAALQLGKALNDPAKGMSRLMRVGVSFTQQQIDQAKALEKSGDIMGAQKIIIDELNKEFGGAAAATASSFDKANVAWKEAEKQIGTALAPAAETAATAFGDFTREVTENTGAGGKVRGVLVTIYNVVKALWPVLAVLTGAFLTYKGVLVGVAAAQRIVAAVQLVQAFVAAAAATDVMTASMVALDVALDVNPLVLIVTALAAVGVGLVVAYHKVKWFHDAVSGTWSWIKGHWPLLAGIMTAGIVPAIGFIAKHFGVLKGAFRDAINFIINGWNKLHFTMPSINTHIPGIGKVGGFDIGLPHIPPLANGGTVGAGGTALIGEEGPELLELPTGATVSPLTPAAPVGIAAAGNRLVRLELPVYLDGRKVGQGVRTVALADLLQSSPA